TVCTSPDSLHSIILSSRTIQSSGCTISPRTNNVGFRPSILPSGMYDEAAHPFTQTWNQNGEKCPDNTIPIRRTKEEDVMRATSVTTFGKKTHNGSPHSHLAGVTDGHHYGVAYATGNAKYYGTKVTINVWKPKIATSRDFSMAQLWITAGSYANKDLNTIEAGWQVYPAMYGDDKTRLFIYWTRDAYNRTGCYNLACSGFIQTNPQFVIGGSISPVSIYGGTQYVYDYLV
ncbi:Os01g0550900, partial [Oryza sativa Japonica Group]